jgi:hypothetical protein
MKALQSFRSDSIRPALEAIGGTAMIRGKVFMMALSAATIARYYDNFEFITDDAGKNLVEECKFPYTKVISVGENFDSDSAFWVHSKFQAYLDSKPFIHFDNDIFLWKELPKWTHTAGILATHSESAAWPKYEEWLNNVKALFPNMPKFHEEYYLNRMPINMAIFGGNDIAAINNYAKEVLDIVEKDMNNFKHFNDEERNKKAYGLMPVIEQLWGSYLLQSKQGKVVKFLLTEREAFYNLNNEDVKFTHMQSAKITLEKDPKKLFEVMSKIDKHLKEINPELHANVLKFTTSPENIEELMESK